MLSGDGTTVTEVVQLRLSFNPDGINVLVINSTGRALHLCRVRLENSSFSLPHTKPVGDVEPYSLSTPVSLEWHRLSSDLDSDTIARLPQHFTVSLLNRDHQVLASAHIAPDVTHFNRIFSSIRPSRKDVAEINIAAFGTVGAGQTSCALTCCTALGDSPTPLYYSAVIGKAKGRKPLNWIRLPNTCAKIIDVPSCIHDDCDIRMILRGGAPNNWTPSAEWDTAHAVRIAHAPTNFERRPHAVLLFVGIEHLADVCEKSVTRPVREQLNRVITEAKNHGYNCIAVLSGVDKKYPQLADNPLEPCAELDEDRKSVGHALGIAIANVRYTVNYHKDQTRKLDIDRLALQNMEVFLAAATQYIERMGPCPSESETT